MTQKKIKTKSRSVRWKCFMKGILISTEIVLTWHLHEHKHGEAYILRRLFMVRVFNKCKKGIESIGGWKSLFGSWSDMILWMELMVDVRLQYLVLCIGVISSVIICPKKEKVTMTITSSPFTCSKHEFTKNPKFENKTPSILIYNKWPIAMYFNHINMLFCTYSKHTIVWKRFTT